MGNAGQIAAASENGPDNWPRFDYASVPNSVAKFLRGESDRIRRQYTQSIVQIGKALLGAKRYLSHGSFIAWVEAEVGIPARTAQAYMRVAQWASGKSASVAHLPPVVLYSLSASNTPPDFARGIIERAEAGEKIAFTDLRKELQHYRETEINGTQRKQLSLAPTAPAGPEMKTRTALEEAIMIIARELSEADFLRIESAFTDGGLTADPNFADHMTSLFSKAREGLGRLAS
jgi:Protein of unknown function (DUF3102)